MSKRKLGVAGVVVALAAAIGISLPGRAVDTAGAPLSVEAAQAFHDSGTTLFIQALTWWSPCSSKTTQPSTRVQSLRNAATGGMDTAGYVLLDPFSTGAEAVDRGLDGIPDDVRQRLQFVAIDFEIPGVCWPNTQIPLATICDALDRLQALGFPRVLYTSYGEWTGHLSPGNPAGCANTYLWVASWDSDPDHANFERYPFGGWQAADVILKQYHGDIAQRGVAVDLDSFAPFPWLRKPVDVSEWGECDPRFGDVWNDTLKRWVFPGAHFYDPATATHSYAPACS